MTNDKTTDLKLPPVPAGVRQIGAEEEEALIKSGWQKPGAPKTQSVDNSVGSVDKLPKNIRPEVATAINDAAQVAGVDPAYMFAMAEQESGFNPNIKAKTSSATGLYQIIDSTWKGLVKKYGDEHGIALTDRKDPRANAIMGALFAKDNKEYLTKRLGREPQPAELYIAHFMGPAGAVKLIGNADGNQSAASLFPQQAEANKSIFYDGGQPRSVEQVYMLLTNKINSKVKKYQQVEEA
jgi:hypothetical protein